VIWAVREQVPRATQSEAESAVIMHGGDAVAAIMELTMG
jgi:NACalpha-BTF3-like transcription factor